MAVDQSKVKSMLDRPTPTNLRELWGFLGLTRYYRKFVKGYAEIAHHSLHKSRKIILAGLLLCDRIFHSPQTSFGCCPDASHVEFHSPFILDASVFGVGHPIAYCRARSQSIYEKELMAVVLAVKK